MTDTNTWSFKTAARTLWQEARSEPVEGQRAVAHVLWNRLRAGRWGHTLAHVCHAPLARGELFQFSGWDARDPNLIPTLDLADDDPPLVALAAVLTAAESEPDPTGGALCYYAPAAAAKPPWAYKLKFLGRFGTQLFYGDDPATGARA